MNSLYYVLSAVLALAVHGDADVSAPSIDICRLVNNPSAFRAFILCLLSADDRQCTPGALAYKRQFKTIVITICNRCNKEELRNLKCFILGLKSRPYLQYYVPMKQKYDPSGRYWSQLEAHLGIPHA